MDRIFIFLVMVTVVASSCGTPNQHALTGKNQSRESCLDSTISIEQMLKNGPAKTTISPAEKELYNLIMNYRNEKKLPVIPMSKSLTFVAKIHVRDLEQNFKKPPHSFHSWSNKGPWKRVNYTNSEWNAQLMWSKPSELTEYNGFGYEISYMNSDGAGPQGALSGWKSSRVHNGLLVNKGNWKKVTWNAIGLGIYGKYAVVWFGEDMDPENSDW